MSTKRDVDALIQSCVIFSGELAGGCKDISKEKIIVVGDGITKFAERLNNDAITPALKNACTSLLHYLLIGKDADSTGSLSHQDLCQVWFHPDREIRSTCLQVLFPVLVISTGKVSNGSDISRKRKRDEMPEYVKRRRIGHEGGAERIVTQVSAWQDENMCFLYIKIAKIVTMLLSDVELGVQPGGNSAGVSTNQNAHSALSFLLCLFTPNSDGKLLLPAHAQYASQILPLLMRSYMCLAQTLERNTDGGGSLHQVYPVIRALPSFLHACKCWLDVAKTPKVKDLISCIPSIPISDKEANALVDMFVLAHKPVQESRGRSDWETNPTVYEDCFVRLCHLIGGSDERIRYECLLAIQKLPELSPLYCLRSVQWLDKPSGENEMADENLSVFQTIDRRFTPSVCDRARGKLYSTYESEDAGVRMQLFKVLEVYLFYGGQGAGIDQSEKRMLNRAGNIISDGLSDPVDEIKMFCGKVLARLCCHNEFPHGSPVLMLKSVKSKQRANQTKDTISLSPILVSVQDNNPDVRYSVLDVLRCAKFRDAESLLAVIQKLCATPYGEVDLFRLVCIAVAMGNRYAPWFKPANGKGKSHNRDAQMLKRLFRELAEATTVDNDVKNTILAAFGSTILSNDEVKELSGNYIPTKIESVKTWKELSHIFKLNKEKLKTRPNIDKHFDAKMKQYQFAQLPRVDLLYQQPELEQVFETRHAPRAILKPRDGVAISSSPPLAASQSKQMTMHQYSKMVFSVFAKCPGYDTCEELAEIRTMVKATSDAVKTLGQYADPRMQERIGWNSNDNEKEVVRVLVSFLSASIHFSQNKTDELFKKLKLEAEKFKWSFSWNDFSGNTISKIVRTISEKQSPAPAEIRELVRLFEDKENIPIPIVQSINWSSNFNIIQKNQEICATNGVTIDLIADLNAEPGDGSIFKMNVQAPCWLSLHKEVQPKQVKHMFSLVLHRNPDIRSDDGKVQFLRTLRLFRMPKKLVPHEGKLKWEKISFDTEGQIAFQLFRAVPNQKDIPISTACSVKVAVRQTAP